MAAQRSRQRKGGGFRNRVDQLKMSLSAGFVYLILGVLVLLNGLFVYSLVTRFLISEKRTLENETTLPEDFRVKDRTIRVEVLNGAGVGGIARKMTDFLRREGFDVIDFGNAESFKFHETVILDRSGDRAAAKLVAQAVNSSNIVSQKNPLLTLDVTLIIGRDYRKLLPFKSERRYE